MQKTKVTINFTSLTNLWSFRMAIDANIFEMNMSQITISCQCSDADIQLAVEKYKAKIVETEKEEV